MNGEPSRIPERPDDGAARRRDQPFYLASMEKETEMTTQNSAPGTDTGTGYGRPRSSHDARLTEVGPGTPMGEALRRHWHPVANSSVLTSDVPHRTWVLVEDLIVFRDGAVTGGRHGTLGGLVTG